MLSSWRGHGGRQILVGIARLYDELRGLARAHLRREREGHTLNTTALVNEAYLRLVRQGNIDPSDRTHFFAVAATAMRQILTDHARARAADKRGGDRARVTLDENALSSERNDLDLIALDDALTELATYDARKHRIVELRFFGGLTAEETARILHVSLTTVESDWRAARAWLQMKLQA